MNMKMIKFCFWGRTETQHNNYYWIRIGKWSFVDKLKYDSMIVKITHFLSWKSYICQNNFNGWQWLGGYFITFWKYVYISSMIIKQKISDENMWHAPHFSIRLCSWSRNAHADYMLALLKMHIHLWMVVA